MMYGLSSTTGKASIQSVHKGMVVVNRVNQYQSWLFMFNLESLFPICGIGKARLHLPLHFLDMDMVEYLVEWYNHVVVCCTRPIWEYENEMWHSSPDVCTRTEGDFSKMLNLLGVLKNKEHCS